jgi:hypothetical protein
LVGPFGSYLLFYGIFATTAFVLAKAVTGSLLFAATLLYLFAFGTQLDYLFTYGNTIALYLVLTYIAVNFSLAALIVSGRATGWGWRAGFVITLTISALSNEMWINYATAMIVAGAFGAVWAYHHRQNEWATRSRFLTIATLCVLGVYLAVRLRVAGQYLKPAAEEELVITYHHPSLLIDDLINNFFSYMYMTLSNYLPSFVSGSISLTYLGDDTILKEQHGYYPDYQQLVIMQHLFFWRFCAGVLVTLFLGFSGWALLTAWRRPSFPCAIISVLALMMLMGFATHLAVKRRPYNSVAALPYKCLISITAWTVLIAYLVTLAWQHLAARRSRYLMLGGVWTCVIVAALTRPLMQVRLLAHVGLQGFGDPLSQLLNWFR